MVKHSFETAFVGFTVTIVCLLTSVNNYKKYISCRDVTFSLIINFGAELFIIEK